MLNALQFKLYIQGQNLLIQKDKGDRIIDYTVSILLFSVILIPFGLWSKTFEALMGVFTGRGEVFPFLFFVIIPVIMVYRLIKLILLFARNDQIILNREKHLIYLNGKKAEMYSDDSFLDIHFPDESESRYSLCFVSGEHKFFIGHFDDYNLARKSSQIIADFCQLHVEEEARIMEGFFKKSA
ncbi:MAG: hypothetical protein JXR70_08850 [Spirochaetales bacterium]|nr:hypothetical protein [Spirochaetales bacterium]